ncbi:DUF1788 domain-containing protein [Latilactobacillus sakei]|uniref:DUF1788 domain-containing protein n=1 Tax=Latilactobacillus sakei TaxID=1599 RepID=UPI003F53B165
MRTTNERLNELQARISDNQFLTKQGLGNEVSFYIFDYNPADELLVRSRLPEIQRYTANKLDTPIKEFNLFDIATRFFEERQYMEKNYQMEQIKDSFTLYDRMQRALKTATERDEVIKYIREHYEDNAITFITGVGSAYPLVRAHTVLNNLQPIIVQKPLILFYPGVYEGNKLSLFNQFKDDNYYRAFRIVEP